MHFTNAVNGNSNYRFNLPSITVNKWYSITIQQTRSNDKIYYSVSVDGKEIRRVENKDPRTFRDVKVFAGDNFHPAADATYRNLVWKNLGRLSGNVKRNTEIATIPSLGPTFRVSFDLKINSHVAGNRHGWSNVISFKSNGGTSNNRKIGDRIPAIFMNRKRFMHFTNAVNGNSNYRFNLPSINVNKWYSITIQQTRSNNKIYYSVSVDGKEIHRVENKDPRTFKDVKVFAGDNFHPAA